jgi:hypothetical protein
VVNELSQWLFSSLTLCMRLLQRYLASVQQWYTTARPESMLMMDFKYIRL